MLLALLRLLLKQMALPLLLAAVVLLQLHPQQQLLLLLVLLSMVLQLVIALGIKTTSATLSYALVASPFFKHRLAATHRSATNN